MKQKKPGWPKEPDWQIDFEENGLLFFQLGRPLQHRADLGRVHRLHFRFRNTQPDQTESLNLFATLLVGRSLDRPTHTGIYTFSRHGNTFPLNRLLQQTDAPECTGAHHAQKYSPSQHIIHENRQGVH
jgi:hypothetical protein